MRRLNDQVPMHNEHRASGQAIVTIARKDHYLGPHGTKASHSLYDRLVAEVGLVRRVPFDGFESIRAVLIFLSTDQNSTGKGTSSCNAPQKENEDCHCLVFRFIKSKLPNERIEGTHIPTKTPSSR